MIFTRHFLRPLCFHYILLRINHIKHHNFFCCININKYTLAAHVMCSRLCVPLLDNIQRFNVCFFLLVRSFEERDVDSGFFFAFARLIARSLGTENTNNAFGVKLSRCVCASFSSFSFFLLISLYPSPSRLSDSNTLFNMELCAVRASFAQCWVPCI